MNSFLKSGRNNMKLIHPISSKNYDIGNTSRLIKSTNQPQSSRMPTSIRKKFLGVQSLEQSPSSSRLIKINDIRKINQNTKYVYPQNVASSYIDAQFSRNNYQTFYKSTLKRNSSNQAFIVDNISLVQKNVNYNNYNPHHDYSLKKSNSNSHSLSITTKPRIMLSKLKKKNINDCGDMLAKITRAVEFQSVNDTIHVVKETNCFSFATEFIKFAKKNLSQESPKIGNSLQISNNQNDSSNTNININIKNMRRLSRIMTRRQTIKQEEEQKETHKKACSNLFDRINQIKEGKGTYGANDNYDEMMKAVKNNKNKDNNLNKSLNIQEYYEKLNNIKKRSNTFQTWGWNHDREMKERQKSKENKLALSAREPYRYRENMLEEIDKTMFRTMIVKKTNGTTEDFSKRRRLHKKIVILNKNKMKHRYTQSDLHKKKVATSIKDFYAKVKPRKIQKKEVKKIKKKEEDSEVSQDEDSDYMPGRGDYTAYDYDVYIPPNSKRGDNNNDKQDMENKARESQKKSESLKEEIALKLKQKKEEEEETVKRIEELKRKAIQVIKLEQDIDHLLDEAGAFSDDNQYLFDEFREKIESLKKYNKEDYMNYLTNNYVFIQEEIETLRRSYAQEERLNDFMSNLNHKRSNVFTSKSTIKGARLRIIDAFHEVQKSHFF